MDALKLNKDQMEVWRNRLVRAHRAKEEHIKRWKVTRDFYKGNYFPFIESRDRYAVNWVFSIVRQMMSVLYFQNPTMVFKPLSMMGEVAAPVMESVIQYERRIIDAEHQERKALQNALLYGIGIMKHGYNAEFGTESAYADPRMNLDGKTSPIMGDGGSGDAVGAGGGVGRSAGGPGDGRDHRDADHGGRDRGAGRGRAGGDGRGGALARGAAARGV